MKIKIPAPAFEPLAAGTHVLQIVDVEAVPRVNPTTVTLKFKAADGKTLINKYDLDHPGGAGALRALVNIGTDLDPDDIDTDELVGKFVTVEIVHREGREREDGTRPVFANIGKVLGPGEPFEAATPTIDW